MLHCPITLFSMLKNVSGYVSKGKESYHTDSLYSPFLNPATAAIRYAMHLDICEPEMWVLLSSKKISWTNAPRKQFRVPDTIEKVLSNTTIQRYYQRPSLCEHMSLLTWLCSFNDAPAVPYRYPCNKVVGCKHFLYFNSFYFYQFLLMHFPHRTINDILPTDDPHIPKQILHFNTLARLMPDEFTTIDYFKTYIEQEGHKMHFLQTLCSHLQSIINMNNLYHRHNLSHSNTHFQV